MDWEIYDLDSEDVVLRPFSPGVKPKVPWKEAQSLIKHMPRSAGSVNRPGRCQYVMEIVRFCHEYDTVLQWPDRLASDQTTSASNNERQPRQLKTRRSSSSLHRDAAVRKISSGTRPARPLRPESRPESRRHNDDAKSPSESSQKRPRFYSQLNDAPAEYIDDRIARSSPKSVDGSAADHGSDICPSGRSVGSSSNSPSTAATSPFEPALAPHQLAQRFPSPPFPQQESAFLDSCYLPRRMSSNKTKENGPSRPGSPHNSLNQSQEYLISSPKTSPDMAKSTESRMNWPLRSSSKRGGGMARSTGKSLPLSNAVASFPTPPRSPVTGQPPRGSSSFSRSRSSNDGFRTETGRRENAVLAKHSPGPSSSTLAASSPMSPKRGLPISADLPLSSPQLASGNTEKENEPAVIPELASLSRKPSTSERIFNRRLRDLGITRSLAPLRTTNTKPTVADNELSPRPSSRLSIRSPISPVSPASPTPSGTFRRQHTRQLSPILPQSPLRELPTPPPRFPLPADPPMPPSRSSSRTVKLLNRSPATPLQQEPSQKTPVKRTALQRPTTSPRSPSGSKVTFSPMPATPREEADRSDFARLRAPEARRGPYATPSLASSDVLADSDSRPATREGYTEAEAVDNNISKDSSRSPKADLQGPYCATRRPSDPATKRPSTDHGSALRQFSGSSGNTTNSNSNPSPKSRQSSHPCATTPEQCSSPPQSPRSPHSLESRLAFLEQQNKTLQAALVAALDVRFTTGAYGRSSPPHPGAAGRSIAASPPPGYASAPSTSEEQNRESYPLDSICQTYL